MLDAVQRDLESSGDGPRGRGWIRLHLERGRTFNSSGNLGPALVEFDQAWTLARESGEDALAIDAAHMLAIAARGDHEASMHWNVVALQLAERSSSPRARRWQASLHNNIGWSHHDAGRFDQALASFQRALELREAQGERREIGIARWCVARCLRSLGRVELALRIQQSLLNQAASGEDAHSGYVREEIAECLLAMGRHAESTQHFAQAHRILHREPHIDAQRLDRLDRLSRGDAMSS
jgi:tetratricopeptide (TPR) repeat protein